MFIPLHDANHLKHVRLQFVTLGFIAANVLVYLLLNVATAPETVQALVVSFGYIPAVVYDYEELPLDLLVIPEELSFVSYAFLHGDFMHIASNMLFLWVFGDNVEDAMGHWRFAIFYLVCAAFAAFAHSLLDPASVAPLIGASGAVSGIIAAYLVLHPRVKIWVLALGRIPLRLPAWIPLCLWIGFQVVMLVMMGDDDVSWAAHVGGLAAGFALVFVFKRRGVPVFDRAIVRPEAVVVEEPELQYLEPEAKPRPWGRG